MGSASGPIVGIDLGTTYSAVAFLNGFGRAEVIPNLDGDLLTPSVVLFPDDGTPRVGKIAKQLSHKYTGGLAEFVKREMGDPDWTLDACGESLTPPIISALILRDLLDSAEARLRVRPGSAVITCPAYFGDLERQATADAGALAELEVLSVFNEPTAAALAYGLHHAAKKDTIRAMVYDLGGGTFDVTVLELQGRRVRVLATAGEHRLGGKDWDDEILNYVSEEFLVEHDLDPRDDESAQQSLRKACEKAKVELSDKTQTHIACSAFGKLMRVDLSRQLFDTLTRSLMEQTRSYIDQVLDQADTGWDDLDVILPVGGSSRMPQIRKLLLDCSGKQPETVMDPDLAVAKGACYYAALLRAEQGFDVKVLSVKRHREKQGKPTKGADDFDSLPVVLGSTLPGRKGTAATMGLEKLTPEEEAAPRRKPVIDESEPVPIFAIPSKSGQEGPKFGGLAAKKKKKKRRKGPPRKRRARPPAAPQEVEGVGLPGAVEGGLPGAVAGLPGSVQDPAGEVDPSTIPVADEFDPMADEFDPTAPEADSYTDQEAGVQFEEDFLQEDDRDPVMALFDEEMVEFDASDTAVFDFADLAELEQIKPEPAALAPGQASPMIPEGAGLGGKVAAPGETEPAPGQAGVMVPAGAGLGGKVAAPEPPARMVQNVNARSLGVLVFSKGQPRTKIMITHNSPLPARKLSSFVTINDNQTAVKVVVLEGESPDPDDCARIGECLVTGLPARPKGQRIEIVYSYNVDGRIQIWARDVATNHRAQVQFKRESSITKQDVAAMKTVVGAFFGG